MRLQFDKHRSSCADDFCSHRVHAPAHGEGAMVGESFGQKVAHQRKQVVGERGNQQVQGVCVKA